MSAARAELFALHRRVAEAIVRGSQADGAIPTPCFRDHDDGSMSIEWRLPDRRVALIVDPDPAESSWHAVSTASVGRMDGGSLASADIDELVAFVLAGIEPR